MSAVSPVFVGRTEELANLAAAYHRLPSAVLIGGEAGVGKSRLLREFVASLGAGVRVLTGGCVEFGGLPYPHSPRRCASLSTMSARTPSRP